ncbi:hypothetical protein BDF14DRAFT_251328 [Spinellus fusiger]|nr:hypothetical protein BDF14DRAFT_251328 [Spinellus fusiger]
MDSKRPGKRMKKRLWRRRNIDTGLKNIDTQSNKSGKRRKTNKCRKSRKSRELKEGLKCNKIKVEIFYDAKLSPCSDILNKTVFLYLIIQWNGTNYPHFNRGIQTQER